MVQEDEIEAAIESNIEKLVMPKGDILNDNDSGVDHLGHTVYAEALAEKIDHVSTPITIGVFARWGSGKSFLLKHVRNLLERRQKQDESKTETLKEKVKQNNLNCYVKTFLLFIFVTVIIIASLWAAYPTMFLPPKRNVVDLALQSENEATTGDNAFQDSLSNATTYLQNATTTTPLVTVQPFVWVVFSRYFALSVLLFCLVFVCIVVCGNNDWWSSQFFANFRLISYVAFTKLPIEIPESSIVKDTSDGDKKFTRDVEKNGEKVLESNRRYIFVHFNAWEFAGSDTLWAGIVTNLSNAIEEEFGSIASRIFRMLQVDAISRDVISDDINSTKATLFVNFPKCTNNTSNVENSMMEFGVVRYCNKLDHWKNPNLKKTESGSFNSWWVVNYSNSKEAQNAHHTLDLKGLEVSFEDPRIFYAGHKLQPPRRNVKNRAKQNYGKKCNDIELEYLTPNNRERPLPENGQHNDDDNSSDQSSLDPSHTHHNYSPQTFTQHFMRHPKTTCNFPNLFWCILMVLVVISLPVITYVIAESFELDIFRVGRTVPLAVQIVSWFPATGAASFVLIKFVWAMFHSQRSRIYSALEGTQGNMTAQLGFMNKVKTEVQYITELIHCAEFSHNKQYKVIIFIDDLDRVALEKIKSVLEAVSILLSDNSSPFVCLIAIDSRVAVKSIEETMGLALLRSRVNGHEYLKKIINLPFCLPEIDDIKKRHYIEGLVDLSDETAHRKLTGSNDEVQPSSPETRSAFQNSDNLVSSDASDSEHGGDLKPAHQVDNNSPPGNDKKLQKLHKQPKRSPDDDIDGTLWKTNSVNGSVPDSPKIVILSEPEHLQSVDAHKLTPGPKRKRNPEFPQRKKSVKATTNNLVEILRSSTLNGKDYPRGTIEDQEFTNNKIQNKILRNKDFLFECRYFLCKSDMVQRHLEGNPRNIKRIFNVISLTSWILHYYEEQQRRADFIKENSKRSMGLNSSRYTTCDPSSKEQTLRIANVLKTKHFAHDLVLWVVLTDQWPYRMSYLLQVIEDSDHKANAGNEHLRIHEDMSLFDIYKKFVLPELIAIRSYLEDTMLFSLDVHPDLLYSFLAELHESFHAMNKRKTKLLKQVTINLDQSLRQTIVCHREIAHDVINNKGSGTKCLTKRRNAEIANKQELRETNENIIKKMLHKINPKESECSCEYVESTGLYSCDHMRTKLESKM